MEELKKLLTYGELERFNIDELEKIGIDEADPNNKNARYVLGRKLIEGSILYDFQKSPKKGLTWLRENASNSHSDSQEYLAYYEMKFEKSPNMPKIIKTLDGLSGKSMMGATTLAEFYFLQAKDKPELLELAGKYYIKSAELGCAIGKYWAGCLYHHGKGVEEDIGKAIDYLTQAHKLGNALATYHLYLIYSADGDRKDVGSAFKFLRKACERGIPQFDTLMNYFKDNFSALKLLFIKAEEGYSYIDEEIINLHNVECVEMARKYKEATQSDELYKRPNSFFTDSQGWLMSFLVKYFVERALDYDYEDFMNSLKDEILPLFSDLGLWMLENWSKRLQKQEKTLKRKRVLAAKDLIKAHFEKGLEYLKRPNKYTFVNKYGAKKGKEPLHTRKEGLFYKFTDYIHPNYQKYSEEKEREMNEKVIACGGCNITQGEVKFQVCAACKKVYYCSKSCQRNHWKGGHKSQCAKLREDKK